MRLILDLKDEYFLSRDKLPEFSDDEFSIFFSIFIEVVTEHHPKVPWFDYRIETEHLLEDYIRGPESLLRMICEERSQIHGFLDERITKLYYYFLELGLSIRYRLMLYGLYSTDLPFKAIYLEHKGNGYYHLYQTNPSQ